MFSSDPNNFCTSLHFPSLSLSTDSARNRYSYIFPNTALISATLAIGKALDSNAIQIFGTVLSVLLVVLWIVVFFMMIRALVFKRLLWSVGAGGRKYGSEASWRRWFGGFGEKV